MMSFYDLPGWSMGILVIGGCVGATLTAYNLFKLIFPRDFPEQKVAGAMTMLGVVATITSLLLAFSAVSVWESFNSGDEGVMNEANDCAMLARDLGLYGTTEALETRAALKKYASLVVQEEWPLLAKGAASIGAWDQLDVIFHHAYKIEAKTPKETVFLGEIWARINQIVKHRRERLHAAQSEVPTTLWVVVVTGALVTFLFAFTLPKNRFNMALLAGLSAAFGLVFFFILALDHPFAGRERVTAEPFELMVENMDRWDAAEKMAKKKAPDTAR